MKLNSEWFDMVRYPLNKLANQWTAKESSHGRALAEAGIERSPNVTVRFSWQPKNG